MRHKVGVTGGAALLVAAVAWRIWGPRGSLISGLGPLPDLRLGDLVTLPVAMAGLAALAWLPEVPLRRRLLAVAGIVSAIVWVGSDRPWHDPVVPGVEFGTHGVHVLDVIGLVPLVAAVAFLVPRRRAATDHT